MHACIDMPQDAADGRPQLVPVAGVPGFPDPLITRGSGVSNPPLARLLAVRLTLV